MVRTALTLTGALFFLAVAGCASSDDDTVRKRAAPVATEDSIGVVDRDLVLKWGAPDAVYEMQDGSRILTWRLSRTERKGGEIYTVTETRTVDGKTIVIPITRQTPIVTSRYECVTSVEVDADGYVVSYTADGNDCSEQPAPD